MWPPGTSAAGYRVAIFLLVFHIFLTISVSQIISTSTGRIFTRFLPLGGAMAVDEPEPRFLIFQGTLP